MDARSALFDLYGDHLVARDGLAPVATLVRCLAALDITAPAVRTAVSRMVRQGWLVAAATPTGPGYALTERGVHRLEEAATRIYRTREVTWDGSWQLLTVERIRDRSRRERVRNALRFLGYGGIDDTTWIAVRPSSELDGLLATEQIRAERFTARHDGDTVALVKRVWDLDTLDASYRGWIAEAEQIVAGVDPHGREETAFAARSRLVHGWRKFLFIDPQLPDELLPPKWGGQRAARYFDDQAARLAPAASQFVDSWLADGRRPS